MKRASLILMLLGLTILSCNKEKSYSKKLMKGEVWAIQNLTIGGTESEIIGDWEVIQDVSIYDTVPTIQWRLSDYDALFDWQFQDKGKVFQLNYHILCEEIAEDELDTLDFMVFDLSGKYDVEQHRRTKMTFRSEATQSFAGQMVEIAIERK
jgi:hypothetical protein